MVSLAEVEECGSYDGRQPSNGDLETRRLGIWRGGDRAQHAPSEAEGQHLVRAARFSRHWIICSKVVVFMTSGLLWTSDRIACRIPVVCVVCTNMVNIPLSPRLPAWLGHWKFERWAVYSVSFLVLTSQLCVQPSFMQAEIHSACPFRSLALIISIL